MELLRTKKTVLTDEEILKAIEDYEKNQVPELDKLWAYFRAKNPPILNRPPPDANNPDNKTVVSYGRKLVKTFQGYAYRPGYITYKSENEPYLEALKLTFARNSEKVKTSRTGRNTGVFGFAYERLYTDGVDEDGSTKVEPLFMNVDPRQLIVFYDYDPDPNMVVAIYFYAITKEQFAVEVMYPEMLKHYERTKEPGGQWVLTAGPEVPNRYAEVPVVAYYLGDEMIGIIEPVRTLIDDFDVLMSDSVNEFNRFANAYLILKRMSLVPQNKKDSETFSRALSLLKRKRVFENVPADGDIKFLLKDTPKDFIAWLSELVRQEIHKQSHVPDFMSEQLGGATSGVAVARMMFDFENLVASAEGDFDIALNERIRLITKIYDLANRGLNGEAAEIIISHKRNVPQDVREFAETAEIMKRTGFSSKLVAETMPDDIIPDVKAELEEQITERNNMFGDEVGEMPDGDGERPLDSGSGDVQGQALNGAQIKSMVELTQGVSDKTMAADSAIALLLVAIPSLTKEQAHAIIDPAASIEKPPPPPVPPQFGGPPPVAPEPPEDE